MWNLTNVYPSTHGFVCVRKGQIKGWVCYRGSGSKRRTEKRNPCSCCSAIITEPNAANSECQMVPVAVVPCLWNKEGRGRSRVARGTGKHCLMWMMCHINTNHARITPTAKLDPRGSSSSTHTPSSPSSGTLFMSLSDMINSYSRLLNAQRRSGIFIFTLMHCMW